MNDFIRSDAGVFIGCQAMILQLFMAGFPKGDNSAKKYGDMIYNSYSEENIKLLQ